MVFTRRITVVVSLLAATLLAPVALGAQGAFRRESWYAIYLQDARSGHMHSVVSRGPGPDAVIRSVTTMEISLSRLGTSLRTTMEMTYEEDDAGRILRFSLNTKASNFPMNVRGEIEGKSLVLKTGNLPAQRRAWDPEVIGPHAAERIQRAKGLHPGAEVSFDTFAAESLRKAHVTVKVVKQENVDVMGRTRRLWRTETTQDLIPGMIVTSWVDKAAHTIKSEVPMLGLTMRYVLCSPEMAMGKTQPAEIFLASGVVRVKRNVPNAHHSREAVYRLRFENPAALDLNLEDERQTILKRDGKTITLRVRAVGPPKQAPLRTPPGFEKYLKATPYLQATDPRLVAAAHKATGDEKDPWRRAKILEEWVNEAITAKNLSVGFASASETLKTREGDCSEHAVLLAALLRADKTPSRVAFGLLYVNTPRTGGPVFGAHMWTEVWLGHWVPLDATLAKPLVDAMHIKLGVAALDGPTVGAEFLGLTNVLGQTSIKIDRVGPLKAAEKP